MIAVVPSPGVRVTVAESLNNYLVKVGEWCDLWGMKLNASKTKTMIVSRSRLTSCLSSFVLPVLEFCSALCCSAADTHLKLLDHVVSGASFLTWGSV